MSATPIINSNPASNDDQRRNWQRLAKALGGLSVNPFGLLIYVAESQPTSTAPAAPVPGQLYFDTTLNKLRVWTGAAWETITSV